jgi:leucine dehydrogenase
MIFKEIINRGHEQVSYFHDPTLELKGIVAIHNTVLGPALGGCRMWNYKSEKDALIDVLRLSKGMTYKAAIAGLNLGGGKAVIIGDPKADKSEELFRSFGRFIEGLGGRYITAEDVGTSIKDMDYVRMETKYVTGISKSLGGSGDPSLLTSFGTYLGIKASVKFKLNKNSLDGLSIVVQGLGSVGMELVKYLSNDGMKIYAYDIDSDLVNSAKEQYGVIPIEEDMVYDQDVDIYAPCALGATINDETIPKLKCSIVAGAANNVLKDPVKHSKELLDRGILYAPDYAINAGGLINVYNELDDYNKDRAFSQAEAIYDILMDIFYRSDKENIPTTIASDRKAEERINKVASLKSFYLPNRRKTILKGR